MMSGTHTVIALLAVGVGIIAGFFAWAYVTPMLPAKTA